VSYERYPIKKKGNVNSAVKLGDVVSYREDNKQTTSYLLVIEILEDTTALTLPPRLTGFKLKKLVKSVLSTKAKLQNKSHHCWRDTNEDSLLALFDSNKQEFCLKSILLTDATHQVALQNLEPKLKYMLDGDVIKDLSSLDCIVHPIQFLKDMDKTLSFIKTKTGIKNYMKKTKKNATSSSLIASATKVKSFKAWHKGEVKVYEHREHIQYALEPKSFLFNAPAMATAGNTGELLAIEAWPAKIDTIKHMLAGFEAVQKDVLALPSVRQLNGKQALHTMPRYSCDADYIENCERTEGAVPEILNELEILKNKLLQDQDGKKDWRSLQKASCLAGCLDRDVVLKMPTGAGKSLCFQLPALLKDGLTIVVEPLLPLMEEQCKKLRQAGIPVRKFNSENSEKKQELIDLYHHVTQENVNLVYFTVESLFSILDDKESSQALIQLHEEGLLRRIVFDECDYNNPGKTDQEFRRSYARLPELRKNFFPNVPMTAVSAAITETALINLLGGVMIGDSGQKVFFQDQGTRERGKLMLSVERKHHAYCSLFLTLILI